jgi:O-antigen/teichoic acid export membrane protein
MSRYLTSIIEQALWSALNLGVALLLAKLAVPAQFGAFVFWASTAYVLSSVQNALTLCHLQVLPAAPGTDPARIGVERVMLAVTLAFLAVSAAGALAVSLVLARFAPVLSVPAAGLFVPAFLLQQYVRYLNFTRGDARASAVQTGVVLGLAAAFLGVGQLVFRPLDANEILALLGAAYGLVGLVGLVRASRGLGRVGARQLGDYGRYLKQSGWIFLGVSSSELLSRFYVFAVGGALGAAVLAMLSFSNTFLRPISLLATSWSLVGRNDLVRRRDAGDFAGYRRMLVMVGLGGVAAAAVWTLVVFEAWPLITTHLFDGRYGEARMILLLWGAAAAIGFGQTVLSTGLQTLHAFKTLAFCNAAAAVFAVVAILVAMGPLGPAGAVIGAALGQGLELIAMAWLLGATLRKSAAGASGPGSPPPAG